MRNKSFLSTPETLFGKYEVHADLNGQDGYFTRIKIDMRSLEKLIPVMYPGSVVKIDFGERRSMIVSITSSITDTIRQRIHGHRGPNGTLFFLPPDRGSNNENEATIDPSPACDGTNPSSYAIAV